MTMIILIALKLAGVIVITSRAPMQCDDNDASTDQNLALQVVYPSALNISSVSKYSLSGLSRASSSLKIWVQIGVCPRQEPFTPTNRVRQAGVYASLCVRVMGQDGMND